MSSFVFPCFFRIPSFIIFGLYKTWVITDYRRFLSMIAESTDSFSIPSSTNCSGVFPSFSFWTISSKVFRSSERPFARPFSIPSASPSSRPSSRRTSSYFFSSNSVSHISHTSLRCCSKKSLRIFSSMHSLMARSMASFNSMDSRYLLIFATKTAYSYKTWQLSMID